jgi:drug/metabolite transporter (DMT)-like permease
MYSIATAGSITLLGQRDLISGNLFSFEKIIALLINWKFIFSMLLALMARVSFIMTNNSLLKIPRLAANSTTITAFVTLIGLVLIVVFNYIFLKEKLNLNQAIGAFLIMFGIFMMLK